jgi:hypothetical protein
MQQLYQTLDTGHVGLFESPTGTGKSLSLICAGLYWLKERQRKDDAGEDDPVAASSTSPSTSTTTTTTTTKAAAAEPDWLRDYGKDKERAAATEKRDKVRERRQALHLRLEEARQASHRLSTLRPEGRPGGNDDARAQHNKKRSGSGGGDTEDKEDEEDADLLPAEYESGKESDDDSDDDDDTSAGFKGKDEKEEEEGEELDRSAIKVGVMGLVVGMCALLFSLPSYIREASLDPNLLHASHETDPVLQPDALPSLAICDGDSEDGLPRRHSGYFPELPQEPLHQRRRAQAWERWPDQRPLPGHAEGQGQGTRCGGSCD